jgi:dTDP-4-dehydrorhamnose reductase
MKLLIIGCNGQLGKDMTQMATRAGFEVSGKDYPEIDVTNKESTDAAIATISPDVIINCSAYTAVDACETQVAQAYAVNSQGVANLATSALRYHAKVIHFSTDYVFDGKSTVPYVETDATNPTSVYGKSKLEGEQKLASILPNHLILRVAWLYGVHGRHFIRKIRERALSLKNTGEAVKVVTDEVGTPTYCGDVCRQTLELLNRGVCGLFHCTNEGFCSRFEFAQEIFRAYDLQVPLVPCNSSEFTLPAPRPAYSVLENQRLKSLGLNVMRDWKVALAAYVEEERLATR